MLGYVYWLDNLNHVNRLYAGGDIVFILLSGLLV